MSVLAGILASKAEYESARSLYARVLGGVRKASGPRSPECGPALANLARVVAQLGEHERAERLLLEALAVYRRAGKKGDRQEALVYSMLMELYTMMGYPERSKHIDEEVRRIRDELR